MKQESSLKIPNIKFFLVIAILLLSMCLGSLLAVAQETDNNNSKQDAALLAPNGPSLFNTFSFYRDRDWFKFKAEKDVKYQIFTRPVNGYIRPDTVIYLYDLVDTISNEDIKTDGSAFIEWTCSSSDYYYLKVQADNPGTFGDRVAYIIQVTSIEDQKPNTYIPDVLDYSQSDLGTIWDCRVVAAACVLGYWDAHGYDLLVDLNQNLEEDLMKLGNELYGAMQDSILSYPSTLKSFTDENVREGIEFFCDIPKYGNNYDFKVKYFPAPFFPQVTEEINNRRPLLYGVTGHPLWGNHWMVTVGYLETENINWTINHDNWSTTHRDIYVDWDEIMPESKSIITIDPGTQEGPEPFYIDFYPKYQYAPYPMVLPWLEPFPAFSFGTLSPFSGINNMPVPALSSISTIKYSNLLDLGGSVGSVWPSNPELFSDQRSMAGSTRLVSFSPYDYNNFSFYNIGGNNYTTGYDSFISNPPQETYLGTSLGLYPFSAKDYNTLFHYPSYSLPQMFIPSLATTPFLGYFSFPYLAPGLLTPGLSTPGLSSLGLSSLGLSSLGLSIGPFL